MIQKIMLVFMSLFVCDAIYAQQIYTPTVVYVPQQITYNVPVTTIVWQPMIVPVQPYVYPVLQEKACFFDWRKVYYAPVYYYPTYYQYR